MPLRIRTVLAASDLSGTSDDVLRTSAELSSLAGAALHVVHAVEHPGEEAGPRLEARRRAAERALTARLRDSVTGIAAVASTRVAPGPADHVILQHAVDAAADLIVVGPHRESEDESRDLGTTADRLVRTSEVPCLIVRRRISLPLRRVLVPSDFSDAACGALDLALVWSAALRMPTRTGERTLVEVVHVAMSGGGARTDGDRAALEEELRRQIDAACDRTGCAGPLELRRAVLEGEAPADQILRRADESAADLLVMGKHGEPATSRKEIGGVSSAVARRTTCPLLLVPPGLWMKLKAREEVIRASLSTR